MEALIVFLIPFVLPLFLWIVAIFMDRKVAKIMNTKSEFSNTTIDELSSETQIAERPLSIFVLNYNEIEKSWKRDYLIERSKTKLKKSWHYYLIIGIGYILLPIVIPMLLPSLNKNVLDSVQGISSSTIAGILLIVYHKLLNTFFVHEIDLETKEEKQHRQNFVERIFWFFAGIFGFVFRLLLRLFKKMPNVFDVFYLMILLVISIFFFSAVYNVVAGHNWASAIGLGLAIGLHIYLHLKLRNWRIQMENYKLLILRVFNMQTNTNFIFKNIWKYWRHIGSYFTVVDKSLLDLQKEKVWRNFLPLVFFAFVFIVIFLSLYSWSLNPLLRHNIEHGNYISLIVLIVIISIIHTVYSFRNIKKRFVRNQDDFDKRLAKLKIKPFDFLSTFKESPVNCFDNTWQFVVADLALLSDVILMDLRGYSEERKGCHKEVNLLLNLVPSSKVTFLMEPDNFDNIYNLFTEACKNISSTSPNFVVDEIRINIYAMAPDKAFESAYSENIVAALINSIPINEKYKKEKVIEKQSQ